MAPTLGPLLGFLVSFLLLSDGVQSAMRESDVGKSDWTIAGLGRVSQFAAGRNGSCFVGTEAGVIARVNSKSGQVAWRSVHSEAEAVSFISAGQDTVAAATISLQGEEEDKHLSFQIGKKETTLRLYQQSSGQLLFTESAYCATDDASPCSIDWDMRLVPISDRRLLNEGVAIVANNQLKMVGVSKPEPQISRILWAFNPSSLSSQIILHRVVSASLKFVVALASIPKPSEIVSLESVPVEWMLLKFSSNSGDLLKTVHLKHSGATLLPRNVDRWRLAGQNVGRHQIFITQDARLVSYNPNSLQLTSIGIAHALEVLNSSEQEEDSVEINEIQHLSLASYSASRTSQAKEMLDKSHSESVQEFLTTSLDNWRVSAIARTPYLTVTNGWDTIVLPSDLSSVVQQLDGLWLAEPLPGASLILCQLTSAGFLKLGRVIGNVYAELGGLRNEDLEHRQSIAALFVHSKGASGLDVVLSTQDLGLIGVSVKLSDQSDAHQFFSEVEWIREESITAIESVQAYTIPVQEKRAQKPSFNLMDLSLLFSAPDVSVESHLMEPLRNAFDFLRQLAAPPKSPPTPRLVEPLLRPSFTSQDRLRENGITHSVMVSSAGDKEHLRGKFYVVSTTSGRLFGLYAYTGQIVWSYSAEKLSETLPSEVAPAFPRSTRSTPYLQGNFWVGVGHTNGASSARMTANRPSKNWTSVGRVVRPLNAMVAPRFQLLDADENDSLGSLDKAVLVIGDTGLVRLSPRTGELMGNAIRLETPPSSQLFRLKLSDDSDAVGMVKGDGSLLCIPGGSSSIGCDVSVQHMLKDLTLFDIVPEAIQGFGVENSTKLQKKWQVKLKSNDILATATNALNSDTHIVPVHVRGDASILHKLASPNLLSVVTRSAHDMLLLLLIDTVEGRVLASQTLPEGAGLPVQLVMQENRIVAHYWNTMRTRFELLSIEMFHNTPDQGPWKLLLSSWAGAAPDSAELPLLHPFSFNKTFIFAPSGVRALGFTRSTKGLTPQSLLVATSSGQVLAVPHRVFSSRRPFADANRPAGPKTPEELEEGLPPYAILPNIPTEVLSYYQKISYLRGFFSDSTRLESTSTVFAYGLDLFATVTRPAAAYDAVGESFNHPLLIAIILVGGTVVLFARKVAKEKELAVQWK